MDKNMLSNLPEEPGVYLMKDKNGTVIYVGKAKILKNRVRQYFQNTSSHTSKVKAMVSNISSFEYIITDSEIEALILECNLIKKYKPYYNILLKDDKNFPFIRVSVNEDYPMLSLTRKMVRDGAKYYGPFTNAFAVREMIDMVSKIFMLPTCRINLPKDMGKKRTCLNAHMNLCIAPCTKPISKDEYKNIIESACKFLNGDHSELTDKLQNEMLHASQNLEFERAAMLRDKINSIKQAEEKQKIVSDSQANEDIIGFYRHGTKTFAEVFFVRMGRLIGRHSDVIEKSTDESDDVLGAEFIKQFYGENIYIPKMIYVSVPSGEYPLLSEWLSMKAERKVTVKCPKFGKGANLCDMAVKNAHQSAVNYLLKKAKAEKSMNKTLISLSEEIGLSSIARRIEAYDISNTSGSDNVGSMVVFTDGRPQKSFYRRFKIDTVDGSDDYKSMTEMIYRRFKHAREEEIAISNGELTYEKAKFLPKPDCIFLDGGKGHLSVISELFVLIDEDIPLFGMVKDDKHRTRALITKDGKEIGIKRNSDIFFMITSIQDEVHRFAIEYHKSLRKKKVTASSLTKIDGVGPETAKKLLKHFKNISAVKQANADDIMAVKGVSRRCAENIYNFFHKKT